TRCERLALSNTKSSDAIPALPGMMPLRMCGEHMYQSYIDDMRTRQMCMQLRDMLSCLQRDPCDVEQHKLVLTTAGNASNKEENKKTNASNCNSSSNTDEDVEMTDFYSLASSVSSSSSSSSSSSQSAIDDVGNQKGNHQQQQQHRFVIPNVQALLLRSCPTSFSNSTLLATSIPVDLLASTMGLDESMQNVPSRLQL